MLFLGQTSERFECFHDITPEIEILRYNTFVVEEGLPYNDEFEGDEDKFIHCCLYRGKELIATARIGVEGEYARISRIAVKNGYRNQGKGTAIVKYAEEMAKQFNKQSFLVIAQLHAKLFYEKMGYKAVGETFIDAGLPHIKMIKPT